MNRRRRQRRRWLGVVSVSGVVLGAVVAATGVASAGSPVAVGESGGLEQAGPALLHSPPPDAPQSQNTGIWRAAPIGVCLSSAYSAGEYVYQGCPYDDEGGGNQYRWPADTMLRNYTYPDDPSYRGNAANLIEIRTRALSDATAFRITLNSMTNPDLVGVTLALGDSAGPQQVPHGANTVMPAQRFVTVHGRTGDVTDAASGRTLPDRPQVTVDPGRRQIEVLVPHAAFDPTGQRAVRLGAAAGLWDRGTDHYLVPQATADRTHPGGAVVGTPHPSAFFDSAFRFHEPKEAPYLDAQQKQAIANGDLSPFFTTVDFTKLAAGVNDDSGVPKTGYVTRIFASRFEKAPGRRLPSDPGGPPPGAGTQQGGIQTGTGQGSQGRPSLQFGWVCRDDCVPDLPGQLQRYTVYVPEAPPPRTGYASLVWTNGYALRPNDDVAGPHDLYQQFAHRPGNPTMVIDVDARGNDEWFYGQSGAAVFEALADARRHYPLDPDRTAIGGFSSGAYGANKLALTFPDVFSRAFICDGLDEAPSYPGLNGVADKTPPVDTLTAHQAGSQLTPLLPSRVDQPVMEWAGANDDFIPYDITRHRADAYARGAYDYEFLSWTGAASEHLTMCKNGMWQPATQWMGNQPRQQNPHHVTYVRNPLMDDPRSGLVGDHAYWLSAISTRNGQPGTIDVNSLGQGRTDPPVPPKQTTTGVATGTFSPQNPYIREFRHLPAPVSTARQDTLVVNGQNIGAVVIDPARAGVDCKAHLQVATDGPLTVTLAGCGRSQTFNGHSTAPPPSPQAPGVPPDGDPLRGAPLPPEVGNAPQPPVTGLPPVRFPPNEGMPASLSR